MAARWAPRAMKLTSAPALASAAPNPPPTPPAPTTAMRIEFLLARRACAMASQKRQEPITAGGSRGCAPGDGLRAADHRLRVVTIEEKFSCGIKLFLPVQSFPQKYFASHVGQITSRTPAVLSRKRGVAQRHQRGAGCGGRGQHSLTNGAGAGGGGGGA